jgi:hypothetical protein
MPLPTSPECIADEERRIGRSLPASLSHRLVAGNGGTVTIDDERYELIPVWDPTSRRSAASSTSHIERETRALQEAGIGFPGGAIALAAGEDGDYIVLDPGGQTSIWRQHTRESHAVLVDWSAGLRARSRREHKAEAIGGIEAVLRALDDGEASVVDISAPETGVYVQFSRVDADIVGEVVGEANLPKLLVYRQGEHLRKALPSLGWLPPAVDGSTSGNWFRRWTRESWNEGAIARLVVATFSDGFGIEPAAIVVTTVA